MSARADPAKPHDVRAGRELLRDSLPGLPRIRAIVADRGYRGLRALADRRNVRLDIKAPPIGHSGFRPIAPLFKVEHAFAQLGRWRRLSRCYEGSEARDGLASGLVGRLPTGPGISVHLPIRLPQQRRSIWSRGVAVIDQPSVPRYGTSPRAHGPDANADSAQAYASLQEPSHGWGSATSNVSTPSLIA